MMMVAVVVVVAATAGIVIVCMVVALIRLTEMQMVVRGLGILAHMLPSRFGGELVLHNIVSGPKVFQPQPPC